jgi:hypothetical protein
VLHKATSLHSFLYEELEQSFHGARHLFGARITIWRQQTGLDERLDYRHFRHGDPQIALALTKSGNPFGRCTSHGAGEDSSPLRKVL